MQHITGWKTRCRLLATLLLVGWIVAGNGTANAQEAVAPSPHTLLVPVADAVKAPRWTLSVEPVYGLDTNQVRYLVNAGNADEPNSVVETTLTMRSSFSILPFEIQYRVSPAVRIHGSVPYVRRTESIRGADLRLDSADAGLGDIDLGIERCFTSRRGSQWEMSLDTQVQIPTGKSIYDHLSASEMPLGTGFYEASMLLQTKKIADPLVLQAGIGVNYSFPRTIDGMTIQPELGYILQTGMGYALSDRLVLCEQLIYSRSANVLLVDSLSNPSNVWADQAYLSHSLVYNKSDKQTMRVNFTLGLNNTSTDYSGSLLYEWDF